MQYWGRARKQATKGAQNAVFSRGEESPSAIFYLLHLRSSIRAADAAVQKLLQARILTGGWRRRTEMIGDRDASAVRVAHARREYAASEEVL
jgi:hypothetical protein